jgi:quercetin dioxygenase-like cupin family protein
MKAMTQKQGAGRRRELLAGVQLITRCWGEKTLMGEFHIQAGSAIPDHSHAHEQIGYLISGRLDLTIDGVRHAFSPGDTWCIPGEIPHSAIAVSDVVALEIFAPVREDYRPDAGEIA